MTICVTVCKENIYFNLGTVAKYLHSTESMLVLTCTNIKEDVLNVIFGLQKDVLKQVDWKSWLHKPGLPPVNMIEW